jgi:hypothetical protein
VTGGAGLPDRTRQRTSRFDLSHGQQRSRIRSSRNSRPSAECQIQGTPATSCSCIQRSVRRALRSTQPNGCGLTRKELLNASNRSPELVKEARAIKSANRSNRAVRSPAYC